MVDSPSIFKDYILFRIILLLFFNIFKSYLQDGKISIINYYNFSKES